ncbi:uncharacterized protein LOC129777083 [Toxorhynchites rutilus septentrionalis]|uniref:uncharacterized protein LOC129777083 n=1 Tax=Toxorhynchites rutilus septentrionalis TaxID=329112 RepID=UPI00247AB1FA|nr:uncharacterized protein LOC129777083 [Toxorhynchites rutilus septentrionalis]
MQYIRERLSLDLPFSRSNETAKTNKGTEVPVVSTLSHIDERKQSESAGTPPSAYGTPIQSPSEKRHSQNYPWQQPQKPEVKSDKSIESTDTVHISSNHNRFAGYPQIYSTPVTGGYVNQAYTNDSGNNTAVSADYNHPHVIREQYWSWSCKFIHQFSNREKILLLVICFLLLIIGGLATYLGIITKDANPLQGGILTAGGIRARQVE